MVGEDLDLRLSICKGAGKIMPRQAKSAQQNGQDGDDNRSSSSVGCCTGHI